MRRVSPRGKSGIAVVLVGIALLALGIAPALAANPATNPFPIRSASVRQDGQQLVWDVTLDHAFSATGLKTYHRALCLLIEPVGQPSHSLCVAPGRHGIALRYGPTGDKRAVTIAATISRSGANQMTARFLPSAIGRGYRWLRWQVLSSLGTKTVEYPRRPVLTRLHTPVLTGCVPAGPPLVFSGSSRVHDIALTFDDGPWNTPPAVDFLQVLERYHVPATFFEIGRQIPEFDPSGSIERRMLADGDMIGDHTWDHPVMTSLSAAQQRYELEQTVGAIRARTGFTPCLWRPPYGAQNGSLVSLARSLGMLTIMWDVDPRDWSTPGTGAIYANVVANAHNGAIVLQHFGGGPRYQTLAALPQEITTLRARGYRFVTVAQLLGLRLIYK